MGYNFNKVTEGVRLILEGMGYDCSTEPFSKTPMRYARLIAEILGMTEEEIQKKCSEALSVSFKVDARNQCVISHNVSLYSLCPHHLLPVHYTVMIAYLPVDRVLGLSKISRLAQLLGRYPYLQEEYTERLASTIFNGLNCLGVAVVVYGEHDCVRIRGPKQDDSKVTTLSYKGIFSEDPKMREEFLQMIKGAI